MTPRRLNPLRHDPRGRARAVRSRPARCRAGRRCGGGSGWAPSSARAARTGQPPIGTWIPCSATRARRRASVGRRRPPRDRQRQRRHRAEHRVGRRRLDPEGGGEHVASRRSRGRGWRPSRPASRRPRAPRAAIQSIAEGSARNPVGSDVPTQSNSWRNRVRPASGAFAPCDTTSGWIVVAAVLADPQDGRALRSAQPLVAVAGPVRGTQGVDGHGHHPGRVRGVHQRVDAAPVELARRVVSTGKTSAVGLVTWLTRTSRVRSVTAARMASADLIGRRRSGTGPSPRPPAPRRVLPRPASR